MPHLEELPTPALLVDKRKMLANASRLSRHLAANGVGLRLHVKSCKNMELAHMCMDGETGPIAVSTLAEAEYFAEHGFKDIIYAVGIVPQKLERVLRLRKAGTDLAVILDNMETASQLVEFARTRKHAFAVLIEIDCDGHRGGACVDGANLVKLANFLRDGGQMVRGVLTHAGSAYDLPGGRAAAFGELAEKERAAVATAAQILRDAGHTCEIASAGSTPTAVFGEDYSGLTEVRAGVFMFMDCVMSCLGVCQASDMALSVLTRVIGKRFRDDAVIIDAGWSALSSDRGITSKFPHYGYGLVCDVSGNIMPHLRVWELNQEHGIICPRPGYSAPAVEIGTCLRILPIHACATANCFDAFHLVEDGEAEEPLFRCKGW